MTTPTTTEKKLVKYDGHRKWHYEDCRFIAEDAGVCNCPAGLKPEKYPLPKDMTTTEDKEMRWICAPCGISANVLTCLKKYGKRPNKLCFTVSTYTKGKTCDVCGNIDDCTEQRDFFYPDFSLLKNYGK